MFTVLSNLSETYYQLVKESSMTANMAKRIMFSLLSKLVPAGEEAQIHLTKGIVDYKVLKQMIPGAKELVHYGILAASDELKHHKDHRAADTVNNIIANSQDNKEKLNVLEKFYQRPDWNVSYGGEAWLQIIRALRGVQESLETAEGYKRQGDLDKYYETLMELTASVNIVDGLAHNTNSILDKMMDFEQKEYTDPSEYSYQEDSGEWVEIPSKVEKLKAKQIEERKALLRLMDSKELANHEDVLKEIMPTLERTDAPLTMKDWISRARQLGHNYSGSKEQRDEEMKNIRYKKVLISEFNSYSTMRKKLLNMSNMADNMVAQQLKEMVLSLLNLDDAVEFITEQLVTKGKATMKDVVKLKIQRNISLQEQTKASRANFEDYPQNRKSIEELIKLIELTQSIINAL